MRRKELPDLSKAEWDLMNQIWRHGRASVADLRSHFAPERGWSHNTVKTMVQRLVKKGYLRRDASQRAHIYGPAVRRRDVVRRALSDSLDRILDDQLGPLVAYAADRRDLTDEEIETLRAIIDRGDRDDE
jgi:BlaI family penicillinase repressor